MIALVPILLASLLAESPSQPTLHELIERGGTIELPAGDLVITRPLVIRKQVHLVGSGVDTRIVANFTSKAARRLAVIDLVGATYCTIEHLTIITKPRTTAGVGILLGRTLYHEQAGWNTFRNLHITGRFSVACAYNVGSELCEWTSCWLRNAAPGGSAYFTSSWNSKGVAAAGPFAGGPTPLRETGAQSNVGALFNNCTFAVYAFTGKEVAVVIEPRSRCQNFVGCFWSAKRKDDQRFGCRAAILLGADGAASEVIETVSFTNCLIEANGARTAIEVVSEVHGLSIRDTWLLIRGGQPFRLTAPVDLTTSNLRLNVEPRRPAK